MSERQVVGVRLAKSALEKVDSTAQKERVTRAVVLRAMLSVAMTHPTEVAQRIQKIKELD